MKLQDWIDSYKQSDEKERNAMRWGATMTAADHLVTCGCISCKVYFAMTGSIEEHGPFELDDLNKLRREMGYDSDIQSEEQLENPNDD